MLSSASTLRNGLPPALPAEPGICVHTYEPELLSHEIVPDLVMKVSESLEPSMLVPLPSWA